MHIATRLSGGGTSRLFYNLFKHMDRDRFELHVLCTHNLGDPQTIQGFEELGVQVHLLPGRENDNTQDFARPGQKSRDGIVGSLALTLGVWRFLRRNRYPIVHIHNYSGNAIYTGIAAVMARCPVVITHDLTAVSEHWKTTVMWRAVNRFYFRNIVESVWGAELRIRQGGHADKVTVLRNGIEIDHFATANPEEQKAARNRLGINCSDFVAVAIGRLADIKRFDRFIHAAAHFVDQDDITFVLGGSGPLEDALKAQAQRLGLGRKLLFTGWIEDPADLYRAANVLVMTSDEREGTPLVVAEAMATGIPVIAVDSPTQREMVTEENGLIVDANSGAIAAAVERLHGDRQELGRLGAGARRTAERQYDVRRSAAELSSIYELGLLGKSVVRWSTGERGVDGP